MYALSALKNCAIVQLVWKQITLRNHLNLFTKYGTNRDNEINKLSLNISTTVCLFHSRNLSQYFKKLYKSVSIRKNNLKFCTVTSTKDTHQIPKILSLSL